MTDGIVHPHRSPWVQCISRALASHPARIIEPGRRARAAVALILEEHPDGLNVLFIERATNEDDYWSGHIGFPGGRAEHRDASLRDTAERETREEIGLNLEEACYVGRISDIAPRGLQIVISCFVYAVDRHPVLRPDRHEVADAFWVPVRELDNPARRTLVAFRFRERLRRFPALRLADDKAQPLWGITYRLLRNLDKAVTRASGPERCRPAGLAA